MADNLNDDLKWGGPGSLIQYIVDHDKKLIKKMMQNGYNPDAPMVEQRVWWQGQKSDKYEKAVVIVAAVLRKEILKQQEVKRIAAAKCLEDMPRGRMVNNIPSAPPVNDCPEWGSDDCDGKKAINGCDTWGRDEIPSLEV